jgi:hypothetical protein
MWRFLRKGVRSVIRWIVPRTDGISYSCEPPFKDAIPVFWQPPRTDLILILSICDLRQSQCPVRRWCHPDSFVWVNSELRLQTALLRAHGTRSAATSSWWVLGCFDTILQSKRGAAHCWSKLERLNCILCFREWVGGNQSRSHQFPSVRTMSDFHELKVRHSQRVDNWLVIWLTELRPVWYLVYCNYTRFTTRYTIDTLELNTIAQFHQTSIEPTMTWSTSSHQHQEQNSCPLKKSF